jgi:hypothetical protein
MLLMKLVPDAPGRAHSVNVSAARIATKCLMSVPLQERCQK